MAAIPKQLFVVVRKAQWSHDVDLGFLHPHQPKQSSDANRKKDSDGLGLRQVSF